jgi:predicted DNA-binding transcriptional regulator YafY
MTWVLTWGAEAEVLGPDQLRSWVVEVLEGAICQYDRRSEHSAGCS